MRPYVADPHPLDVPADPVQWEFGSFKRIHIRIFTSMQIRMRLHKMTEPYLLKMDPDADSAPDPALFFNDLQDANKK
jgi:hypothetical protein